ncbi:MAG: hypothetical protein Q9188_003787 [Gyalolechia gomerana]
MSGRSWSQSSQYLFPPCVGAIISTYHDGAELVAQIKANREAEKTLQNASLQDVTTQEHEASLHRVKQVVEGQLDRDASESSLQWTIVDRARSEAKRTLVTRIACFGEKRKDPVVPVEKALLFFNAIHRSQGLSAAHTRHLSNQRSSTATSLYATDSFDTHSRVEYISPRDGSSIFKADQLDHNPWAVSDGKATSLTNQGAWSLTSSNPSRSSQEIRSITTFKRPIHPSSVTITASNKASISAKDLLPSEANRYSGFCKGAWRLQIRVRKKAMDERQRAGSMYSALKYQQCSRCKFKGRLVQTDRKTARCDRQVMLADGVQFRWESLFKSHVECRDTAPNPLKSTFGCIFRCAEDRGTPTIRGAQSFMDHFQEHEVRLPVGEVLYSMNCLIDCKASVEEDFDIDLEVKEGITF